MVVHATIETVTVVVPVGVTVIVEVVPLEACCPPFTEWSAKFEIFFLLSASWCRDFFFMFFVFVSI